MRLECALQRGEKRNNDTTGNRVHSYLSEWISNAIYYASLDSQFINKCRNFEKRKSIKYFELLYVVSSSLLENSLTNT